MQDRFSAIIARQALYGPYRMSERQKHLVTEYGHVQWINGDTLHSVTVQRFNALYGYWQDIHRSVYQYVHNANTTALKLCNKYRWNDGARVIMNGIIIQDSTNGIR